MIWEVFRQERKGQAFQHAGSLSAPDRTFAEEYAREFYGRRAESEALWVVPRDAILEVGDFVDELKRNYHRVDGYPLKEKLKEARERQLLLELADDELILGWRDSEWTGIAPFLEEDVAFSSIAQNEVGHARALYELAARELGTTADELAFDRAPGEYRCSALVQLRLVPDWARTIARHVLYEEEDERRLKELMSSADPELAGLAAKIDREEAYHRIHAQMWAERLRGEPRFEAALEELRPAGRPARGDDHRVRRALGGDDDGAPQRPGGDVVVTEERVREALAAIPDPEIPVISIVDLGVVRDVAVEGERVRVEFTPTFLGCPALEAMRVAMEDAIRDLGAEPEIDVVLDDSWSTDRITPEGREKLREAGFAPPAPREATAPTLAPTHDGGLPLPVLRLDGDAPGEHLRPDPVPLAALLRQLPPAVRAVQDDLRHISIW